MKSPELIGVAGTFAGGKDTLAVFLVENNGFTHISTSDMVREFAKKKYGNIERPTLQKTATELRKENGAGVLVAEALKKPRPLVITGIRSLGEAKTLKEAGGVLVFVDAPIEIRFERMKLRQRDDESQLTLDQFAKNESKEWHAGDNDEDFNLRDIKKMADVSLDNSGSWDEFFASIVNALGK